MKFNRTYYLNELIARKHNGMIKIITGLRRSGKSFLLFELFKDHLLANGVGEDHIVAISLENRRLKNLRIPMSAWLTSMLASKMSRCIMC